MPSHVKGVMHLLLQVSDLKRTEDFYVNVLGFSVRDRQPFRDDRQLVVTHQGLGITTGGPGDGKQVEHIAFEVEDLTATAEHVKRNGAKVLFDVAPNSYGKSMYIADPDDNKIELIETPKK